MKLTGIPWAVRLSYFENAYSRPLFPWTILTHKVGTTGLVLVCNQGSLVGLCMQDYKSLCAAVTICATLFNIRMHTHTQTDRQQFDQLIWFCIIHLNSWAKNESSVNMSLQGWTDTERAVCDHQLYMGTVKRWTWGGCVPDCEATSLPSSSAHRQPGQHCSHPHIICTFYDSRKDFFKLSNKYEYLSTIVVFKQALNICNSLAISADFSVEIENWTLSETVLGSSMTSYFVTWPWSFMLMSQ